MQYTPHYNLNLPEGNDIVNPLVQDNPNYSAIDTALYANKLRVIGTATELTTGTVHALTRADQDIDVFRFVATSNYNAGDTFTVDGVSVTVTATNGQSLPQGAYVINASILCILDGTKLNILNIDTPPARYNASNVYLDSSTNVTTKFGDIETELTKTVIAGTTVPDRAVRSLSLNGTKTTLEIVTVSGDVYSINLS